MDSYHSLLLAAAEVRWLLGRTGLQVSRNSPFRNIPELAAQSPRHAEVQSRGWRAALAVLAQPDRCVRAITARADATKTAFYYSHSAAGSVGLVGCWFEGENIRISFPATVQNIAEDACRNLKTDIPYIPDRFSSATLSLAGLWTLMATIDVLRSSQLTSMLERRIDSAGRFDRSLLRKQVDLGLSGHDARWSVTLLRLLAPAPLRLLAPAAVQADVNGMDAGLSELAAMGLVALDDASWLPGEALLRLAIAWASSLPAMAHEIVTLRGDAEIATHEHCIAIRGEGPLWIMEFSGLTQDKPAVLLSSINGSTYIGRLHKMIGHSVVSPSMPLIQGRPTDLPE
jgi:hypothetical protein